MNSTLAISCRTSVATSDWKAYRVSGRFGVQAGAMGLEFRRNRPMH